MLTNHPSASRPTVRLVAALAVSSALLVGCGSSGGEKAAPKTTTTTEPTPASTTTAPDAGPTTTGAAGGSGGLTDVTWETDAQSLRGKDGETHRLDCPPDGTPATIWGVETYTDDSSICTAAVHVGLITVEQGGSVEIEVAKGAKTYGSGAAHDITSVAYGPWAGSFTFPKAPPGSGTFDTRAADWSTSAASLGLKVGEQATLDCSAGGQLGTVWGTDTYTADSDICTAAVHQGLITRTTGGKVAIEVSKGLDDYEGSTAHGVTSNSYGEFALSYAFTDDQPEG